MRKAFLAVVLVLTVLLSSCTLEAPKHFQFSAVKQGDDVVVDIVVSGTDRGLYVLWQWDVSVFVDGEAFSEYSIEAETLSVTVYKGTRASCKVVVHAEEWQEILVVVAPIAYDKEVFSIAQADLAQ